MPRSAIATGVANAILAPEDMPGVLMHYASNPARALLDPGLDSQEPRTGLPAVFNRLRQTYHLDFNLYKPATISRRLDRRVALGQAATLESYCEQVLRDPVELDALYKDLLIGVTRFFRDPEAFDILRDKVVPEIVAQQGPNEEARIWVPGCATGEEAYSLAILFLEEYARLCRTPSLKIFATDVHRDSLQTAAEGIYSHEALAELSGDLRQRYFLEEAVGHYRVTSQLRRLIIFSQHNVLKDPPFTKIDLVSCRNLLIYFQPVAQTRAIGAFYFALRPQGVLFLGPSESTGDLTDEFAAVDRHWKIYRRVTEHRRPLEMGTTVVPTDTRGARSGIPGDVRLARAYDQLLARYVPTGVLVNERREALHFFGTADRFLRPAAGRVTQDVVNMARGDLRIAISSGLQSCLRKLETIAFKSIRVPTDRDGEILVDISVEPLNDKATNSVLFLVLIREPQVVLSGGSEPAEPFRASEESRERIQLLESELQHTRESLQTAVEELETSNEELQASNEELLASNEELQSTNEELHSVNEELHSVNAEHEQKIQELHEVASDLRNLMQATEIGTVFTDREQRIRLFTPAATAIFNLLPQDVGRDVRHITSRVPGDDVFDQIALVAAGGEPRDARVTTPEGRTYLRRIKPYVDLNRDPGGLIITFVDVSRLTAAEAALRASEEQFRLIFESAPDGILTADEDGRIAHANAQIHAIFGYEPGTLVGRAIEDLIPSSHRGAHRGHRERYHGHRQSRRMGQDTDFPALRRDGTEFRVEVGLSPVQIAGRSLILAFVTDITERKKAEARRLQMESKMIEAAKLESLGVLAGGIAHDFNNLLTGILGSASLATMEIEQLGPNPELRESICTIEETARRAADLCKQLLAYAGKGRFVVEPLNLTTIVEQMNELIRTSVGKQIDLRLDLDRLVPPVVMDATQIRQVIMNLVINASEAIQDRHGSITVSTGLRHCDAGYLRKAFAHENSAPGEYVFLSVSDTGCGIAADEIPKIFEPFFTTKFTGRGLGLSAVLGIVRAHKGMLTVDSGVGIGTTFQLLLPPTNLPSAAAAQLLAPRLHWRGSGTVLVVDDEPDVRRTAARLLQSLGFGVQTAADGIEAIEIFERDPDGFVLVLLDLTMPRRDGYETFTLLKRLRPAVRILLMSGFNQAEAIDRFASDMPASFLPKPFTSSSLGEAVRSVLA